MHGNFFIQQGDGTEPIAIDPSLNLIQHLFLNGKYVGRPLCSGLGRCGLCRVRYVASPPAANDHEKNVLRKAALDKGWRLACQHHPRPDDVLILMQERKGSAPLAEAASCAGQAMLAVDLGTTSVKWALQCDERTVSAGSFPNPQLGAGSEVMSRLALAQDTLKARFMRSLVIEHIMHLIQDLGVHVSEMTISGNSAMVSILLEQDVTGMCRAPYSLEYWGDRLERLDPGLPMAYIPPLIGPFLGADVSCGLAWLQQDQEIKPAYPFVFADLGTNGEIVLAFDAESYMGTSVPLGPALEGCGLSHGSMAGRNVVTGFRLDTTGVIPDLQGSGAHATGISGTGYLSLLALLRRAGILGEDGRFSLPQTPLGRSLQDQVRNGPPEPRFRVSEVLEVTAGDVEELLKIKAAFNIALSSLLKRAKLHFTDLSALYLAGAIGEHVDVSDLEVLGFIPPGTEERVRPVGNSSLKGAQLLHNSKARGAVRRIAERIEVLDLPGQEEFDRQYVDRMVFAYV